MRVRTTLLTAMVIAPVIWGVACDDDDGPTAPPIPADVQALEASLAPYSSLALAKTAGHAAAITAPRDLRPEVHPEPLLRRGIGPCNAT